MRDLILIFICAITLGARGEIEKNTNGCPTDFDIELLLSHNTYCNKFYHCKLGDRVERICPSGLVFNEEDQICDWPKNVDCENREINEEINNEKGSHETENDNEENNSNGDGVTESGDNNDGGLSDPSEAPAICAAEGADGVLVAHENCQNFYKCFNGQPITFKCPANLLWNPSIEKCDWPKYVDCGDRFIPIEEDVDNISNEGSGDDTEDINDNEAEDSEDGEKESDESNNNTGGNSDPSEAPALCAAEDSDGVLISNEVCNKFYKCAHGLPVVLKCPSDLLWNPSAEQCDWPENVECGDRVIPDNEPEDNNDSDEGENEGNADGDNHGEDNETEDTGENDVEDSEDNNSNGGGNSDPSEAPALCAAEGSDNVLVANERCNKFYICANGLPVALKCPSNLLWNPSAEKCDWPENVNCGDRVIPDKETEDNNDGAESDNSNGGGNSDPSEAPELCAAEGSDGVLVANEGCNKFYICANGLPITLKCPSDLLWNPSAEQCDWPENVECGDRVIPDNEGENNNSGDETSEGDNEGNEDGDNNGEDNVTEGPCEEDEEDTEDNNSNGGGNSDPSEAPALCAAEGSESVLVANENCNKFYICANGRPVAFKCPPNLLWNPSAEKCDWPENVDCGDRVIPDKEAEDNNGGDEADNGNGGGNSDPSEAPELCAAEGSDGVLVANEDCNKFYICANGLPIALRCPSDLLWNPSTEQCDWPENVECGDRVIPDNEAEKDNGGDEAGEGDNEGNEDGDNNGEENVTENPREEDEEDSGDNNSNGSGNSDPSEAPELCAAEGSDSVLVANEDCDKFYKCANGLPVTFTCPSNLLWNPSAEKCDWPENVECGDRVIPDNEAENDNGGDEAGEGDNEDNEDGDNNGEENVTENPREEDEEDSGDNNSNGSGNSDPSEAPELCAAEGSDSVLVANEDCDKFYKCANGLPVTFTCPSNLLWNPSAEKCDWPENVECGDRVIPDNEAENDNGGDEAGEGDNEDNEDGDNNGEENVTENPREEDEEDSGDNNSNGGGNSDPSEAPELCAAEGSDSVLVANEDCDKFYKCANGLPVTFTCPSNLLWNPSAEKCDWPENVDCGDRVIPDNEAENDSGGDEANEGDNESNEGGDNNGEENVTEDPREEDEDDSGDNNSNGGGNSDPSEALALCAAEDSDGVLVAHKGCNKFYKCANGLPVAFRCPSNLLWNPNAEKCDWPENVECNDRVIPDNEAENDNDGDESDNGNGGGHSDPSEAPELCAAEGSDGVLVANEGCNKFYKCAHGLPVALKCPSDLLWNPSAEQCDWPENVKCGDRVIPDNDAEDNNDGDEDEGDDNAGNEDGNNNGEDNETEDASEKDEVGSADYNSNGGGNIDPSEAPALCAAEDSDGVLVAHEVCNKFYKCSNGLPVALTCPSNLYWQPVTEVCDWPENVDCKGRLVPDNKSDDDENDSDAIIYSKTLNRNKRSTNSRKGVSDPSLAPAICSVPGTRDLLISHEYCNQYYICHDGKPWAFVCSGNLLYNPDISQCDSRQNVDCGRRLL